MLLMKVPVLVIVHPKTNKFDSGGMIKAGGHLKFMNPRIKQTLMQGLETNCQSVSMIMLK